MSTTPIAAELVGEAFTTDATETEARTIADVAIASVAPMPLDEEQRFHVLTVPVGGRSQVVDLDELRQVTADRPRRKTGTYTVRDAGSFLDYFKKHGNGESEVWADIDRSAILGVLNAHGLPGNPGFEDHRVTLGLKKSKAWLAWEALNGKQVGQGQFAEHLEDRSCDVVAPSAADLLEVAQTFRASNRVEFLSSQRLSSGEVQMTYQEEVNATAGKKGQLLIPEVFELALAPYEGSPTYKVRARLRYRINGGNLTLGYALERPEDVLQSAFNDVVADIASDLSDVEWAHLVPVLVGWPSR